MMLWCWWLYKMFSYIFTIYCPLCLIFFFFLVISVQIRSRDDWCFISLQLLSNPPNSLLFQICILSHTSCCLELIFFLLLIPFLFHIPMSLAVLLPFYFSTKYFTYAPLPPPPHQPTFFFLEKEISSHAFFCPSVQKLTWTPKSTKQKKDIQCHPAYERFSFIETQGWTSFDREDCYLLLLDLS